MLIQNAFYLYYYSKTVNREKMNNIVVKIESGRIKGQVEVDYNGENYYSFKGIPYAKAPLGKLRFKVSNNFELRQCIYL